MEIMNELCKDFEKLHPGYSAWYDVYNSEPYNLIVYFDSHFDDLPNESWAQRFESVADFSDWIEHVVL